MPDDRLERTRQAYAPELAPKEQPKLPRLTPHRCICPFGQGRCHTPIFKVLDDQDSGNIYCRFCGHLWTSLEEELDGV